ncbi:YebC/PmpR family DNA-binding transcriptional regulator [Candidatus Vesicomyidisocius sp. SY067_SCS001]|uniref:YebC/PmpR family DNA-binding transcriptional regulator n=1 Tax=Candidatus Vesicomyidisocius sp. SY067_SCS001 TaxID=2732590 RepID=UPI001689C239|nr:YebC/PmpR family DNA-binding transcriptional regulator [Candidatus Vesicomyosocius sp. SY067_SCS001]
MAGHSKWHNIQHRKGIQDVKRGKIFGKFIKEIIIATKTGGSMIENNPSLKIIIDRALAANMKRDTIENAVKRGSVDLVDNKNYDEVRYEGYGLAGTAIIVDTLTNNRNRTVADVRHAFSKYGSNLSIEGSVSYLFTKQGFINFETGDEEQIMEVALDAGAKDIITNDNGSIYVITTTKDFFTIRNTLITARLEPSHSEVIMKPINYIKLNLHDAEKFIKLIDSLEDLDDTREVYHNADISDEIVSQF